MGMKIDQASFDKLQKLLHSYIDENGKEICNPMPKELSPDLAGKPTLHDKITRAIALELAKNAEKQQYETFRDAQNFDLKDDMVARVSGYEFIETMEPDPSVPPPEGTIEPEPEPSVEEPVVEDPPVDEN